MAAIAFIVTDLYARAGGAGGDSGSGGHGGGNGDAGDIIYIIYIIFRLLPFPLNVICYRNCYRRYF
jgi:hypothetical protein